jgi:hypothetical protein
VDAQQGGPLFPNLLFSGFFIDKYPWNATLHAFKQFFFFFGKHLSNMFKRYAVLAAQMDLLNDYHKCLTKLNEKNGNIDKSLYHDKEAQRRLLQFEKFQTKRIEIEGNLFCEIAKYYLHVGKDTYVETLIDELEEWEHPCFTSNFESLNNENECKKLYNKCDQKINSIDKFFKNLKRNCLGQIKEKLNI